jgi:serine/threonine protein kinase
MRQLAEDEVGYLGEYCSRGSIEKLIPKYDYEEKCEVAVQVASALALLHALRIFHLDLKPQNILVDNEGKIRIADFGLSQIAASVSQLAPSRSKGGTPKYAAPEQLSQRGKPDYKTDVYGFAGFLIHLFTGKMPWSSKENPDDVNSFVKSGELPEDELDKLKESKERGAKELYELVVMCMAKDQTKRPDMKSISAGLRVLFPGIPFRFLLRFALCFSPRLSSCQKTNRVWPSRNLRFNRQSCKKVCVLFMRFHSSSSLVSIATRVILFQRSTTAKPLPSFKRSNSRQL